MPTKRPKRKQKPGPTWADVSAAKQKGYRFASLIYLTVLRDKMGMTDEDVTRLEAETLKLTEEIAEGRVTLADLVTIHHSEYHTNLHLKEE